MNITHKIVNNLACFVVILSTLTASTETFELNLPNTMEEIFVQTKGPWSKGNIKFIETNGRPIKRACQAFEVTAAVDQFSEPILEKLNAAKYRIIFNCYDRA